MDILTDRQFKTYQKLSRYENFPIYYNTVDKKWVTGTTAYLSDRTSYQNYKVAGSETYDLLALHFYNNPTLYWIICSFNHVQDPFSKPKKGTVLKIPVISQVEFE